MRLVSWIGGNDLDAAEAKIDQPDAIAESLANESFMQAQLLYGYPEKRVNTYLPMPSSQCLLPAVKCRATLASPIDFHDICLRTDTLFADLTLVSSESDGTFVPLNCGAVRRGYSIQ